MLIAACAAAAVIVSVTGMFAYLTNYTDPVTNTFVVGKLLDDPLDFILKEHEANDDDLDGVYVLGTNEVDGKEYTVLPGVDLPKDPFVKTAEALKLDAYVFIEVVDETGSNVHFTVDTDKWTALTGKTEPNGGQVYVMKANGGIAEAGAKLGPISILKANSAGKEITVDNAVITDAASQFSGKLTFYGYMIQTGGFADYNAAWAGLCADSPAAG